MLISLEGMNATGKTTLAYSGPLPIVGFAFDMGWERAIYGTKHKELFAGLNIEVIEFDPDKLEPDPITADITIYELPQPIQLDGMKLHGYTMLWTYFIVRLGVVLGNRAIRTIVLDTATTMRRVKADAHLEALQGTPEGKNRIQLIQIEYGKVNDPIRNIYTSTKSTRQNLVAVHHLTDERKDQMNAKGEMVQVLTGRKILEGLGNTSDFMDCSLLMEKDGKGGTVATWLKCGYNLAYEKQKVSNPTWDMLVELLVMATGGSLKLDRRKVLA